VISRGRMLDLGLAAVVAAQLGASAWLVPVADRLARRDGSTVEGACWFRAVADLDCPFCGMTRSFVALAHGDVASAFRFHLAGPLLFAAMAAALVAVAVAVVRRGPPLVERRGFVVALEAVAVVCLVIGVFQMVRS
jgi:hypothetical protein